MGQLQEKTGSSCINDREEHRGVSMPGNSGPIATIGARWTKRKSWMAVPFPEPVNQST